jgi:hypothetical protein
MGNRRVDSTDNLLADWMGNQRVDSTDNLLVDWMGKRRVDWMDSQQVDWRDNPFRVGQTDSLSRGGGKD